MSQEELRELRNRLFAYRKDLMDHSNTMTVERYRHLMSNTAELICEIDSRAELING